MEKNEFSADRLRLRQTLVKFSTDYDDRDAFASDASLLPAWGGGHPTEAVLLARAEWCRRLWDATHRTFKEVAVDANLSMYKVAQRFSVPLPSSQRWSSQKSTPPLYTMLMIQELLGLLPPLPM